MSKNTNINDKVFLNELEKCDVPGCSNRRNYLSKYCVTHAKRLWRYGHLEHSEINKRDYAKERQEVKALIDTNLDHEGIKEGIRWFQAWLDDSEKGIPRPCRKQLAFLHQEGVTGYDLLVEASAFYLAAFDCTTWMAKDHNHFKHQLGSRVLNFKAQRAYGSILLKAHDHILSGLRALPLRIKKAVEGKKELIEKKEQIFNQPLNLERSM